MYIVNTNVNLSLREVDKLLLKQLTKQWFAVELFTESVVACNCNSHISSDMSHYKTIAH